MPELRYAHVGSTTYNLRDARLDTVEDSGAEFTSRTATHDGAATIETLRGNTIVWNQQIGNRATNSTSGITITPNADGTDHFSGTATANVIVYYGGTVNIIAGHRCLLKAFPGHPTLPTNVFARVIKSGSGSISDYGSGWVGSTGAVDGASSSQFVYIPNGAQVDFDARLMYFDLTLMFGAGNEPATVAEFEALYPEAYYAYDAGTLLPVNVAGMTTTGTGWTQTRAIDATYMPLRKAGSVYDELTAGKLTRRVGVVDLGSLSWTMYSVTQGTLFRSIYSSYKGGATNTNNICAKYSTAASANRADGTVSSAAPGYIDIIDNAYTDAATFKTAMSGVYLFYELATPTETTISPALNLSYRVENGGTETWEPPSGEMTAPVDTDIAYGWLPVLAGYVQS